MAAKPFTIDVPDAVLDRIRTKLTETRIGYTPADDADWRYGMDAGYLADLVCYWHDSYDWRAAEVRLNRLPQFKAEVGGIDLHFIHVRQGGFPIILTHGWPGSVVEFEAAIPLLAAQGFDLVVPSLPGYGWSDRPAAPIGPQAVARLWRTLMVDVLGYQRFGAQGGDWGSAVTARLGAEHADVVAAIHLNFFMAPPPGQSDHPDARDYWAKVAKLQAAEGGYQHEHATKPQTIGLALHDNPVGWAAWVIEKFQSWGDTHGDIESSFTKDQLITNLMTYLVNDAVQSSIWMYYGSTREPRLTSRVEVPTGLALFPGEFYPYPSRDLAEGAYAVARWTEMPAGGHFVAFEQPEAFAGEVGAFFGAYA